MIGLEPGCSVDIQLFDGRPPWMVRVERVVYEDEGATIPAYIVIETGTTIPWHAILFFRPVPMMRSV